MTNPDDAAHLREQSATEKLAALQYRGLGDWRMPDGTSLDAEEVRELRSMAKNEELATLRARLAEVERERNAYKGRIADADVSIGNLQAAWKKMKAERNAALARADKLAAGVERVGSYKAILDFLAADVAIADANDRPLEAYRAAARDAVSKFNKLSAELEAALAQGDSRAEGE